MTEQEIEEWFLMDLNIEEIRKWKKRQDHGRLQTRYSVSFVVSFQNRWASFDDPNRWIVRFQEDLELYRNPPWKLDPELPHPSYWDDTDYMQHRIIGPVVLTVHEYPGNRAPTLQPGTYSRTPRISRWEAPGHILTDAQVDTRSTRGLNILNPLTRRTKDRIVRLWPDLSAPNPGFPLPGHVLAGPEQGPGTEAWREHGMDGHEW